MSEKTEYPQVTPDRLLMAYGRALKRLTGDHLQSATESAGFILNNDTPGTRTGVCVFITMAKFDEALLRTHPDTGGFMLEGDPLPEEPLTPNPS